MQASCDASLRFGFVGLGGPGVIPDRDAMDQCALGDLVRDSPSGCVSIRDAACTVHESLCALCHGDAAKLKKHDSFDFHGSQCCI